MGKIYTDKIYYVYALCEPGTEDVRYIGISIHPKARLREHMGQYYYWRDSYKLGWIKKLKDAGQKPSLLILDSCVGWEAARIKEKQYYDQYNNGNLLNSIDHLHGGTVKERQPPAILDPNKCQGVTKRNKQCARNPDYSGFCCKHRKY